MINPRQETLSSKPSFREAFKKRRCLIPADGFYEWYGTKGRKQPVFISLPDRRPFAFAGLWETWQDKGEPEIVYRSCAIITREAKGASEHSQPDAGGFGAIQRGFYLKNAITELHFTKPEKYF